MHTSYLLSVFVKELPGYILLAGVFMSMALLLLLIAFFRLKLTEGESGLGGTEWVGRQNFSIQQAVRLVPLTKLKYDIL